MMDAFEMFDTLVRIVARTTIMTTLKILTALVSSCFIVRVLLPAALPLVLFLLVLFGIW